MKAQKVCRDETANVIWGCEPAAHCSTRYFAVNVKVIDCMVWCVLGYAPHAR